MPSGYCCTPESFIELDVVYNQHISICSTIDFKLTGHFFAPANNFIPLQGIERSGDINESVNKNMTLSGIECVEMTLRGIESLVFDV